tara:strand:- start:835 stop:960 length:126 start_codon:yes stop_codon:yes gene_type:complete
MRAAFEMKIEKFNTINLEAKVNKLAKDEEKTMLELTRRLKA